MNDNTQIEEERGDEGEEVSDDYLEEAFDDDEVSSDEDSM